jgi:hypothetical protein
LRDFHALGSCQKTWKRLGWLQKPDLFRTHFGRHEKFACIFFEEIGYIRCSLTDFPIDPIDQAPAPTGVFGVWV